MRAAGWRCSRSGAVLCWRTDDAAAKPTDGPLQLCVLAGCPVTVAVVVVVVVRVASVSRVVSRRRRRENSEISLRSRKPSFARGAGFCACCQEIGN